MLAGRRSTCARARVKCTGSCSAHAQEREHENEIEHERPLPPVAQRSFARVVFAAFANAALTDAFARVAFGFATSRSRSCGSACGW